MKVIPFLFILFFFSCSSKHKIPRDILSQEKMEAVLWDMTRADEFVSSFKSKDSSRSLREKSILAYEEVFKVHQINKTQFEKSVKFYNLHPDLFKPVADSLEKRKNTAFNESFKPTIPIRDSLRKKDSIRIKLRDSLVK